MLILSAATHSVSLSPHGVHRDNFIKTYTDIYVNTQQFFCLTHLYFARGDMFRLLIQPSSGQLTIEQDLMCAQYGIPHCLHIKYM